MGEVLGKDSEFVLVFIQQEVFGIEMVQIEMVQIEMVSGMLNKWVQNFSNRYDLSISLIMIEFFWEENIKLEQKNIED